MADELYPEDLRYHREHDWVRVEGDEAVVAPCSLDLVRCATSILLAAELWGLTPLDQMWCRIQFRSARYEGPYTPPGISRLSILYPGMFGGIEWGGVAVDPQRRILIANPSAPMVTHGIGLRSR